MSGPEPRPAVSADAFFPKAGLGLDPNKPPFVGCQPDAVSALSHVVEPSFLLKFRPLGVQNRNLVLSIGNENGRSSKFRATLRAPFL